MECKLIKIIDGSDIGTVPIVPSTAGAFLFLLVLINQSADSYEISGMFLTEIDIAIM